MTRTIQADMAAFHAGLCIFRTAAYSEAGALGNGAFFSFLKEDKYGRIAFGGSFRQGNPF